MLQLQLERLRAGLPDEWAVAVATSHGGKDDPIAELASALQVAVVRGPEHDVLARFQLASEQLGGDPIVRLTGDCPLTDPAIVQDAVRLHAASNASYTSNVFPRSYPKGLDVEVLTRSALRSAADEARDPVEREHVTPFIVRRPERFSLANLFSEEDLGEEWWTVDRPEDLDRLQAMVDRLSDPVGAGWRDVLDVVGRRATPMSVHLRPLPPSAPGSCPWVRAWTAIKGTQEIGSAQVAIGNGQTTTTIDAPGHEQSVAAALANLLAGDVQVTPASPT